MSTFIPLLEPNLQIGDYVLHQLVETLPDRQIWLGQQISVKRDVELVCYYGSEAEEFLADIRVKASVEDGSLGLVYEAIPTDQFIAFAREALPSRTLQSLLDEGQHLYPKQVTSIIRELSRTLSTLEEQGIARQPFALRDIHLDEQDQVRLRNIAKAGEPRNDAESRVTLAEGLRSLLKFGEPGATRMNTLLDYIKGTDEQSAIPWRQAESLATQVEEQLKTSATASHSQPVHKPKKSNKGILVGGIVGGVIILALGIILFLPKEKQIETDLILEIPAGSYPRPQGGTGELPAFRIDSSEVTIREYNRFLMAWQDLTKAERKELWGPKAPSDKVSIRPLNWNEYYPLARQASTWNGRPISLDHPVTGVDWWDASAYAKWKGGQLPSEAEWWAAAHASSLVAPEQPAKWASVGGPDDLIYGLGGNVAEWARTKSRNPAFPIDSPKPVVLGGSFQTPDAKALSREWLDSPTQRAEDIGFRVTYPTE